MQCIIYHISLFLASETNEDKKYAVIG